MFTNKLSSRQPRPRPMWFSVLLLLDAFVLGGLIVWRLVLNLLASKMVDPLSPDAIDTLVGIDHTLFPYWFGHIAFALLLGVATFGGYLWLRTRSSAV